MPGLVLDCSVAIAWLMPDEHSGYGQTILDRVVVEGAIVPDLWPLEVGNTLLVAERRKRIAPTQRLQALHMLADLPITLDQQTHKYAWNSALDLAEAHQLTLYDATYLELASRCSLPFATLDKQLVRAAGNMGISVPGRAA